MPTYDWKCHAEGCGVEFSRFMTISQYIADKGQPNCIKHGPMERKLSVVPAASGLANALAGDRHYDGLTASDGTDISSRTKHREYMKANGLTDAGDFAGTWKKQEKERTRLRQGTFSDKNLRTEIEKQVMTAVAQPD